MTEPTREPDGSGVLAPDAGERPAADVPRLLGQVPVTSRARSQMTDEEKSEIDAAIAELWREFKASNDQRLRERLILHYSPLVKYVAGRVGVGLPPNIEQADLVSYGIFGLIDAIEKFDIEPGDQVRDLRDQPHQGRDHRRAAGDRLDPALGPLQGARGREGLRRARGAAAPHADRGRGRRRARASTSRTCTRSSARSRSSTSSRSTSCSTSAASAATSSAWSTPSRTPRPRTRSPRSRPRRRSTSWPGRSTRCPSARRSSSPSTTTRA